MGVALAALPFPQERTPMKTRLMTFQMDLETLRRACLWLAVATVDIPAGDPPRVLLRALDAVGELPLSTETIPIQETSAPLTAGDDPDGSEPGNPANTPDDKEEAGSDPSPEPARGRRPPAGPVPTRA